MILVDTNVVIDVSSNDPVWADWSQQQIEAGSKRQSLAINDIVYAELCVGYRRVEDVDSLIAGIGMAIDPIPRRALFLAGKPFNVIAALAEARPACCPIFLLA